MNRADKALQNILRTLINIAFILVGVCIVIGVFDISPDNAWFPWLILLTGIFILSAPNAASRRGGIVVAGLGIYGILRAMDIVSVPWLRAIIGGFLILVGLINIIRNSIGGEIPIRQTFSKQSKNGGDKENL